MNNAAFRSHLMQQFMASARSQATRSSPLWQHPLPDNARLKHRRRFATSRPMLLHKATEHNSDLSSSSKVNNESSHLQDETYERDDDDCVPTVATAVQTLLRTRRTSSHYRYPSHHDTEYFRSALDRAVLAGRSAPNHKRTEAVSFRRIVAKETIEKLAEIAVNVSHNPTKGEKWKRVPAFLVTLVQQETAQEGYNDDEVEALQQQQETLKDVEQTPTDLYVPLPYTPPSTERELEDYAAACAATQNVLLSLHSEGLATKWATGPVIQTPAFRRLVQASATDRIVALVFVGESASNTIFKRRYRRDFHGDFLRDV